MARKKNGGIRSDAYRKPPVEYQFQKGTSGNPKGRPKKKAKQPMLTTPGGEIFDRFSAIALEEATRNVTVREGDKVSEIPAIQALFRAMFRAASQGDTKAGRQLLELLTRSETARAESAVEILQLAVQYQKDYGPIFDEHARSGLQPPDIYPHPDDVIINEHTGAVTIEGPATKEQAGAREVIREEARASLPRYFTIKETLKKDSRNTKLKHELKGLEWVVDFLKSDAERNARHRALQQARQAAPSTALAKSVDNKRQS